MNIIDRQIVVQKQETKLRRFGLAGDVSIGPEIRAEIGRRSFVVPGGDIWPGGMREAPSFVWEECFVLCLSQVLAGCFKNHGFTHMTRLHIYAQKSKYLVPQFDELPA